VEGSRDQNRKNQGGKNKKKMKQKRRQKISKRKRQRKDKKNKKKEKMIEVKRVAEEWEIWDKEKEAAKSEAEVKKLVPEKFHK